jgi:hypothetical protein
MSIPRIMLLFLLASNLLFLVSCAKPTSPPPHLPPPPRLELYPNNVDGLKKLINDMVGAIRNEDTSKLDALMKKTEFADYASYITSTYSPDPLVGEGWAVSYREWLTENEGHLEMLLRELAADKNGKVLVRKANDDPAPGKGLEWGLLHYARIPVEIYRVTLILSQSPDRSEELTGYYVYLDGMFRFESVAPFAKTGTYQSDDPKTHEEPVGSGQYPNTTDGLQRFLTELRTATKAGDQARIGSMIKQTEIPEYRYWYCSVYIPGSGVGWGTAYGETLAERQEAFKLLWVRLAEQEGEVQVRKLVDKPGSSRGMEWGMLHNSRTPLDMYYAAWKSATGATDEVIGYFFYIDGMFRFDSTRSVRIRTAHD